MSPAAASNPHRVLSVVVPIYNERNTVREALDAILAKAVPGWELQIIMVESNSTDGTRAIVQDYAAHPRVKLILEDRPRGKGHAVRAGFAHATGDVIIIQDADLEYDLNDYDILLAPIAAGRQTFVLGSRHSEGGWAIRKFSDQPVQALEHGLFRRERQRHGFTPVQSCFDADGDLDVLGDRRRHQLRAAQRQNPLGVHANGFGVGAGGYRGAGMPVGMRNRTHHAGRPQRNAGVVAARNRRAHPQRLERRARAAAPQPVFGPPRRRGAGQGLWHRDVANLRDLRPGAGESPARRHVMRLSG